MIFSLSPKSEKNTMQIPELWPNFGNWQARLLASLVSTFQYGYANSGAFFGLENIYSWICSVNMHTQGALNFA